MQTPAKMSDQPFEYKFLSTGGGGAGARHCTHCPKLPGESCTISCGENYDRIKRERAADGVVVNDTP